MRIEHIENGFLTIFENKIVDKVLCKYDESCTIIFHDKSCKELKLNFSSYNSQYGIPVSEDGRILFVSSWEEGLFAYDIASGSVIWHLKTSRITSIVVHPTYVSTQKYGESIIKLSIDSGKVLSEIKSGTIETQFHLGGPHILVNSIKGKLSVVDTDKMLVTKKYRPKIVNPSNSLSIIIQNAVLEKNELTIFGLEDDGCGTSFGVTNQRVFERIIDKNFSTLSNK